MNRTDRLYALVEELRAVSPRPRSASWLARRFEVSARTIERDLGALRESGVPLYATPGRTGGYTLDRSRTLPPLMLTAEEALAIGVALSAAAATPFAQAARSAAHKIRAVLPEDTLRREQRLAGHIHRLGPQPPAPGIGLSGEAPPSEEVRLSEVVRRAVAARIVLRLSYTSPDGAATQREVEPQGLLWSSASWYLIGWCRRRAGIRGFRLDRITAAELTGENAPDREAQTRAELSRLAALPLGM